MEVETFTTMVVTDALIELLSVVVTVSSVTGCTFVMSVSSWIPVFST